MRRLIDELKPDVMHGHGAKAGAFVRLRRRSDDTIRILPPHGGSLHYPLHTLKGEFYARLERTLMDATDLFLFESALCPRHLSTHRRHAKGVVHCVFNGVTPEEFEPVVLADDATDLAYVGEFRHIKARISAGRCSGPTAQKAAGRFTSSRSAATVRDGGVKAQVVNARPLERHPFHRTRQGALRLLQGAAAGRPLARDSMPYVVIEAGAAGIPMIAACVGGIPEIFGPVKPGPVRGEQRRGHGGSDRGRTRRSQRNRTARLLLCASASPALLSQQAMVEGAARAGYRDAFANH